MLWAGTMFHPRSPCVSVCRIAPDTGLCEGCQRTMAEISGWPRYSAREKREVLHRVEARREEGARP